MQKQTLRLLPLGLGIIAAATFFLAGKSVSSPPNETAKAPVHSQIFTSKSIPSSARFIAFGDWGAGTQFQKDVAAQTVALHQKAPFDTVLTLGDNIYEKGDVNRLGKAYFTDTYAPLLQKGVHFIVALGNHDEAGGFQDDQVRFFKMPGYYYNACRGPFEFFVIDSNSFTNDEIQKKWLDRALGTSQAEWKIVLGHHPIYSSGEHGNNPGLKRTLEPLLIKHHVPLYLAGHDHDYERFASINGIQYIVSGGGGAYLRNFFKTVDHSLVRLKAHHFLSFALDKDVLKMQVIDKTGEVIDSAQWAKPAALVKPKRASDML